MSTEAAIERLGGCGLFQILLLFAIYFTAAPAIWSTMFMAFGNFNPGWKCHQWNSSVSHRNSSMKLNGDISLPVNSSMNGYITKDTGGNVSLATEQASCDAFKACDSYEFLLNTSTVVTEWKLFCDKDWIVNLITSLQMAGSLLGNYLGGQLSDKFGRKWPIYVTLAVHSLINIGAYYCRSWELYGAIRFFLGIVCGIIITTTAVHPLEFSDNKWRPAVALVPSWNFATIIFAVMAMILKDFRSLHIAFAAVGFVLCTLAIWVPESLRWLVVHDKVDQAHKVSNKMAWWNRKQQLDRQTIESIAQAEQENTPESIYTFVHLFTKNLRKRTLVCSFVFFAMNILYYVIYFGMKALTGDLYINIIISQLSPLPFMFIASLFASIFGRKFGTIAFFLSATVCCLGTVVVHFTATDKDIAGTVTLVLAMIALASIASAWGVLISYSAELYPTVIRLLAFGFLNTISRVGAIAAPFLIPTNAGTLYISYIVIGVLGLVCCALLFSLPETKGKAMSDTFGKKKRPEETEHIIVLEKPV